MERTEQNTAGTKLALLSNINMDFVIRLLKKQAEVWQGEGYGNELGLLINPDSSYHAFEPDITFLVTDLCELLEHDLEPESAGARMDRWFGDMSAALRKEKIYYISDAYLWGPEISVLADEGRKAALEHLWQERLEELCREKKNVRIFPYRHLIESLGEENAFSAKMWYMGKILLGNEAQKRLCELILHKAEAEMRVPKKVLLLDLDNTLWGGLAGEQEHAPVELSDDHGGLAYKNLQRVILQMQKQGVLLGIVSKNNEADAMEILERHPHMVLRPDVFAARRINWAPKHESIREIAEELNLGLDSFVLWDDSPQERQLVKEMLPQVTVPDFPERKEELAFAMGEIYRKYFAKPAVTAEDKARTAQYAANAARNRLAESAGSFEGYLKQLEIVAARVNPRKHEERLVQLLNKTNQFNLTTRRYTQGQMAQLLEASDKKIYLYSVSDRFGDNGIVAAAVVDCSGEVPVLTDFVMSCRVMGKNIEYALVEDIERNLRESGYDRLQGIFLPSARNMPVAGLYEKLGYLKLEREEQCNAALRKLERSEQCNATLWEQESEIAGTVSGNSLIEEAESEGKATKESRAVSEGEAMKESWAASEREATKESEAIFERAVTRETEEVSEKAGMGEAEAQVYEIQLAHVPERMYYVKIEEESAE